MNRIQSYLSKIDNKIVLTGDFNIAPNANDRAIGEDNEKRWLREGHTAFLPEELEWFSEFEKLNLYDTWRTKTQIKIYLHGLITDQEDLREILKEV